LNESQSGLDAVVSIERVAELGRRSLLDEEGFMVCDAVAPVDLEALLLSAATAGSVTPRAAARAIVLRNWLRIIREVLLCGTNEKRCHVAARSQSGSPCRAWLRKLVRTHYRVAGTLDAGFAVRRPGLRRLATIGRRGACFGEPWSDRISRM